MKLLLPTVLTVTLLFTSISGHSADATSTTYKAGDLLSFPIRSGNYVMLLWGWEPVWFDSKLEWFQYEPVRNYTTRIYLDITRMIAAGDYQFLEIESAGDPNILKNWRWVRENKVQITKCDGFKFC